MTEAMIAKANENKQKLGYQNVKFILGEIEDLPIQENSIDVVISNCVLNLVPDKHLAYKEVHRVLKSNGHFNMSDVVLRGELPKGILEATEMYASCISGAMEKEAYLEAITQAGFKNLKITKEAEITIPDDILQQYATTEEISKFKTGENAVISLGIYAEK